jgi:hypothetical protein
MRLRLGQPLVMMEALPRSNLVALKSIASPASLRLLHRLLPLMATLPLRQSLKLSLQKTHRYWTPLNRLMLALEVLPSRRLKRPLTVLRPQ